MNQGNNGGNNSNVQPQVQNLQQIINQSEQLQQALKQSTDMLRQSIGGGTQQVQGTTMQSNVGQPNPQQADSGTLSSSGCASYPHHVVAVKRDSYGNISHFKLEDGTILDYQGCIDYIHNGQLNLIATTTKSGSMSIRSQADGDSSNNLSSLPTFN